MERCDNCDNGPIEISFNFCPWCGEGVNIPVAALDDLALGVQPDPRAAKMVSEAAELQERYGDFELGDL